MSFSIASQHIPVHTAPDKWIDTEEEMLKRMHGFQKRLDELEKIRPDSVEAISKQMEAQRGILDLLTKYREAKQAKLASYRLERPLDDWLTFPALLLGFVLDFVRARVSVVLGLAASRVASQDHSQTKIGIPDSVVSKTRMLVGGRNL